MIFDLKLDILYLRDCDDRVEAWLGLAWAGLDWAGLGLGWAGLGRRWEVSSICIFLLLCPEPRRQPVGAAAYLVFGVGCGQQSFVTN